MKNNLLKKAAALGMAAAMVVSMAACGSSTSSTSSSSSSASAGTESTSDAGSSDAAESTGTILDNGRADKVTVAINVDPQDLEPDAVNENPRFYFIYSIYENLFDFADDNSGELVPCMAESYVDNGDSWDVTLKSDVYDWNGNNITASDVAFCYNWLIDAGNAIRFDYFDSIEVTGDYTFTFHWTTTPPSVSDLEFPLTRAIVFSQKAYEENGGFATNPVGTGHYKVSEFVSGSKLVLEANDDYWGNAYIDELTGRHQANVQTIELQVVTESQTAVAGLEKGTLDVCSYVPTSMMSEFEESDDYSVEVTVSGDYYYLAPNCLNVNEDLRKAIFYAIDNNAVATAMGGTYMGMETFGTSYYTDWSDSFTEAETFINTYDVETAQSYLDASGFDTTQTLTLLCGPTEAAKAAAQMVQVLLQQIGIQTSINSVTQDVLQTNIAQESGWDLAIATIGGPNMVGSWHLLFDNEVNGGKTTSMVADDTLQELYDAACADATHDTEHMQACLDYVVEHAYMYSLVGESSALVYNNKITEMYKREGYYTVAASTYAGQ